MTTLLPLSKRSTPLRDFWPRYTDFTNQTERNGTTNTSRVPAYADVEPQSRDIAAGFLVESTGWRDHRGPPRTDAAAAFRRHCGIVRCGRIATQPPGRKTINISQSSVAILYIFKTPPNDFISNWRYQCSWAPPPQGTCTPTSSVRPPPEGYKGYIDLDSSAGLNIVYSYAQIVQLIFRNVQSKRRNCAVRHTQSFGQAVVHMAVRKEIESF